MKKKEECIWLYIITAIFAFFLLAPLWEHIICFSDRFNNLLSLLTSAITVCFAAIATFQAKKTIQLSHKEFENQNMPVLLYSNILMHELDITTIDGEYRFYLTFANHGRSIALLRRIESSDKYIQYNLSPPISVGVGENTSICVIHSEESILRLINRYVQEETGDYSEDFWKITVTAKDNTKIVELSRIINFNLIYWNTYGYCYKTEVEFNITIYRNVYLFVKCFLNAEMNLNYPSENDKMPKKPENYCSL